MKIPSVYEAGYEKARALNPDLASLYIEHTRIGDPAGDAVIKALASYDQQVVHRLIQAGMERDKTALATAPAALRDFFDRIETPPPWFDPEMHLQTCRVFHADSDAFNLAFFIASLKNFSTMISKSFYLTGRVASKHAPRRVLQNTRHFLEAMLPGSLERDGDCWKLSVRIRLVHAQVRRLLRMSEKWDEDAFGVPLSAAHLGLAAANFSAASLQIATQIGADVDEEKGACYMQTWRYVSHLVGVPEALLFEGDTARTLELSRVGSACEPLLHEEPPVIAGSAISAVPAITDMTNPVARRFVVSTLQRFARAILGDDTAERLGLPPQFTTGFLLWARWKRRAHRLVHRLSPQIARKWRSQNFLFMLNGMSLDDITYKMPDHLEAKKATPW